MVKKRLNAEDLENLKTWAKEIGVDACFILACHLVLKWN